MKDSTRREFLWSSGLGLLAAGCAPTVADYAQKSGRRVVVIVRQPNGVPPKVNAHTRAACESARATASSRPGPAGAASATRER